MDTEPGPRKRPAPRGTAAYPRKRAVAACQTCRSRKTKCDNRRPICSFCERVGATCIYATYDLSAYDPASLAILDRMDQLEENLKAHMSSNSTHSPLLSTGSQATDFLAITDIARENGAPQNDHFVGRSDPDALPLPNTVEHVLSWPIFAGRFEEQTNLVKLLQASPFLDRPATVNFEVDAGTCQRLLDRCMEHVLSKNPVLEKEALQKSINSVCLNGIGWDADSCVVLLICALGSIAPPGTAAADWAMARSYFGAAQKRIGMLMSCDGLIVPQCYFLAGIYFMYHLKPLEAWRMFAQAVVCMHPTITETIPMGRYSLDECVYWSCWKSEIELRLNLQLPSFGVIGNRYPPLIPEPPSTDASNERTWFYYLADISLRRLDMSVREAVAAILRRTASVDAQYAELAFAVPTLEEQLEDWMKSMPDGFNLHGTEESILHFILKGRLLDSYDVLYIPFLERVLNGQSASRDIAPILDMYSRKALECSAKRMSAPRPAFTVRHHGTWLMFRTCTRSAIMILAARLAGRLDLLPANWQEAIINTVTILGQWREESNDLADRLHIIRALSAEVGLEIPV